MTGVDGRFDNDFSDRSAPCNLCGARSGLRLSHIIPAFAFKWLKETSATGYLRAVDEPNLRAQDGPKCYLLCQDCEQLFGVFEQRFAEEAFLPMSNGASFKVAHDEWLTRFAVSLSWRVNRVLSFRSGVEDDLGRDGVDATRRADAVWREYLLGRTSDPGIHRQHLLLLDYMVPGDNPHFAAPRMNQYLLRGMHFALLQEADCYATFTKLGRFLFVGHLRAHARNMWKGTGISLRSGVLQQSDYGVPGTLLSTLRDTAREISKSAAQISDKQQDVLSRAITRDPSKTLASGSFAAMLADGGVLPR